MDIAGWIGQLFSGRKQSGEARNFEELLSAAHSEPREVLKRLGSRESGLVKSEARAKLRKYGLNKATGNGKHSRIRTVVEIFLNPLVALMSLMAIVSFLTAQFTTAVIIVLMIGISTILNYLQETKADKAAEKLKAMVQTTATVLRDGVEREIALRQLVPGDMVKLSAGDIVPADVRIIFSKDLFVNQSTLTGESVPVEKHAPREEGTHLFELQSVCFMGTSVESGTATAVVLLTGKNTYFGSIAESLEKNVETGFEKGIASFTDLMIRFILLMAPAVFFINWFKGNGWFEAFLFALAVVVGLTPELLPMIITVNLAKGAVAMSAKKVIVKKLSSIQNLGAMNVLCTDKTGTLTQGRVILVKHIDLEGNENEQVLRYAYLNSYFQTGLKNVTDQAVLKHENLKQEMNVERDYKKIDEVGFDFQRRRMSVIVDDGMKHLFVCKGAIEETFSVCERAEIGGRRVLLKGAHLKKMKELARALNEDGFRVIAVAYKELPRARTSYSKEDEGKLVLAGFIAFLDPPKESAMEALARLDRNEIAVKILTGDNEVVTGKICRDVNLKVEKVVLGDEVERLSDEELGKIAEHATVFARLSPKHKERIIGALRRSGHTVGFLGDGINDAPALRASDVGISVDSAADIAKESSSIILLETSLLVLNDGVVEGRKVFGNIDKYIKMAASSNFGNMLSVLGASLFMPFLPMLPLQVLVNNLLYDFSQATIPLDNVDKEWVERPRRWTIERIKRYILVMGPISSVFDFTTFGILIFMFNGWNDPALFRTGWFVESLMTQTLIIHVIRTDKIPILESRASMPLIVSSLAITAIGILLPFSPVAGALGFVALPLGFLGLLGVTLVAYFALAHIVKTKFAASSAPD